jgi:hypothetical protein
MPLGVEKSVVLAYLDAAPTVVAAAQEIPDEISGEPFSISDVTRTDGEWLWHQELNYYVRKYDIRVPDELLDRMTAQGFRFPEVGPDLLRAAAASDR